MNLHLILNRNPLRTLKIINPRISLSLSLCACISVRTGTGHGQRTYETPLSEQTISRETASSFPYRSLTSRLNYVVLERWPWFTGHDSRGTLLMRKWAAFVRFRSRESKRGKARFVGWELFLWIVVICMSLRRNGGEADEGW